MVRAVKTKPKPVRALKKGESAVLLPGATGAEPWEAWILGSSIPTECVQTCPTPLDNRLRKNSVLAFPAAQVFCLPLWLNETDARQFAGMIPLQLELRGLQPRNGAAVFDWSVVAQEGTRTLVMVGVLPATLPAEMNVESYDAFDLSVRYFRFPENALVLWQEQDHLVVAMTRGANLVYYQVLTEGRITPRVLQDIACARAVLSMQGIITNLQQAALWTDVTPTELAELQKALQLPIHQGSRPEPRAPSPAWKLVPAVVGEAQRAREFARWRNRGLLIALALYLIIAAALGIRYFLTLQKVNELSRWQTANADALQQIHATQAAWKELRPVVDTDSYPLELLSHAADAIPQDQFHLTLFEAGNGHILIKGEAKNIAAAFQFSDHLKADPHFANYTWDIGQPHLLPNDLAQIQIEGTRAN